MSLLGCPNQPETKSRQGALGGRIDLVGGGNIARAPSLKIKGLHSSPTLELAAIQTKSISTQRIQSFLAFHPPTQQGERVKEKLMFRSQRARSQVKLTAAWCLGSEGDVRRREPCPAKMAKPSAGWCFAVAGPAPWQLPPIFFLQGSIGELRHREACPAERRNLQLGGVSLWRA